jgi:hypothetical protein
MALMQWGFLIQGQQQQVGLAAVQCLAANICQGSEVQVARRMHNIVLQVCAECLHQQLVQWQFALR